MTELRDIKPLLMPSEAVAGSITGSRPVLQWMPIASLRINDAYQRGLTDRSVKLIRRIVENFDWRRLKPLIVTAVGDGQEYEIIDGQHTAIAAVTRGDIEELPALLITAEPLQARAGAFLGHNRDRVIMQAPQLFHAAVAAGDEDALTVAQVCSRAGVRILRMPPASGHFREGDCIAIAVLRQLVNKRGAMKARMVLEACVRSGAAPVSAPLIKAADAIMHDREYAGTVEADDLVSGLIKLRSQQARIAELAAAKALPLWRASVVVLYQSCRKRRAA